MAHDTHTTLTTRTGRVLRVRTRSIGRNFGTVAELVARNGRVVATTDPVPLGFAAAAHDLAERLAEVL